MKEDDKRELLNAFGLVGNIGLMFAACIGVGLFGGRFIDEKLETAPAATIIGILLGVFAGAFGMYKRIIGK